MHKQPTPIPYGQRVRQLAEEAPDWTVLVFVDESGVERHISYREFEAESNRAARLLQSGGAGPESLIVLSLPARPEFFYVLYAAWKLGAATLPLNPLLPDAERDAILHVAGGWRTTLTVSSWGLNWGRTERAAIALGDLRDVGTLDSRPLPLTTPNPGKTIGSGGSTGRPKIIVTPGPWQKVPDGGWILKRMNWRRHQTQLVTGRLYQNIAFSLSNYGIFDQQKVIVMEKFDAGLSVDLIEKHQVNFAAFVPTMMQRIARLPGVERRDFSSFEGMYHSGSVCPPWVKRVWLDLVPPTRQWDCFGSAEAVGIVSIRGDEWLQHPGSIGRPIETDMKLLGEDGTEVGRGDVGEIFLRPEGFEPQTPSYQYVGSPNATTTPDGYTSVGDLGWVDENGWLFLADRRTDLVITGGANVYPAEVESVISEHADVVDVVVIGIPDDEWGQRVHAVVEPRTGSSLTAADLNSFCRQGLVSYKCPKTYEFVAGLPRDESGKIRRSSIAAARSGQDLA